MILLAGDIGGTKTNLAVFSTESGQQRLLQEDTFPSRDYASLEELVAAFLAQVDVRIEHACFGVAGPVVSGEATITNLPWEMKESQLAQALNLASVELINDLAAIAYAIPILDKNDLHTLKPGQPQPGGAMAVIAPGTGLGEAYLTWNGDHYQAHPSEGGHTDFAPTNAQQIGLLQYLQKQFGRVSFERVCSGQAIPSIYAFLKESGYAEEPAWLQERLADASDPSPIITNAALDEDRPCELCRATLEMFIDILGAETGNMALKVMASGGVYLGGGIPPRILSALKSGSLVKAFLNKGRMAEVLEAIPIYVILNPKAALLGAAHHGFAFYKNPD